MYRMAWDRSQGCSRRERDCGRMGWGRSHREKDRGRRAWCRSHRVRDCIRMAGGCSRRMEGCSLGLESSLGPGHSHMASGCVHAAKIRCQLEAGRCPATGCDLTWEGWQHMAARRCLSCRRQALRLWYQGLSWQKIQG